MPRFYNSASARMRARGRRLRAKSAYNSSRRISTFARRARVRRGYVSRGARSRGFIGSATRSLGVEVKYFDVGVDDKAIPASLDWTATGLNPATPNTLFYPQVGDTASTRDGNKCVITRIEFEGIWKVNPGLSGDAITAITSARAFIALVLDTQTNKAGFTGDQVYVNPTATTPGHIAPLRNMLDSRRFKVLKAWSLVRDPIGMAYNTVSGTLVSAGFMKHIKFVANCRIPIEFVANAGTVADLATNSIGLIGNADQTGAPSQTLTYNVRFRYLG